MQNRLHKIFYLIIMLLMELLPTLYMEQTCMIPGKRYLLPLTAVMLKKKSIYLMPIGVQQLIQELLLNQVKFILKNIAQLFCIYIDYFSKQKSFTFLQSLFL